MAVIKDPLLTEFCLIFSGVDVLKDREVWVVLEIYFCDKQDGILRKKKRVNFA